MTDEQAVVFLYLLMRDEVVPGIISAMWNEIEQVKNKEITYSNKYLEGYARELVARLK